MATSEEKAKVMKSGFTGYLTKPIRIQEILNEITPHLKQKGKRKL